MVLTTVLKMLRGSRKELIVSSWDAAAPAKLIAWVVVSVALEIGLIADTLFSASSMSI